MTWEIRRPAVRILASGLIHTGEGGMMGLELQMNPLFYIFVQREEFIIIECWPLSPTSKDRVLTLVALPGLGENSSHLCTCTKKEIKQKTILNLLYLKKISSWRIPWHICACLSISYLSTHTSLTRGVGGFLFIRIVKSYILNWDWSKNIFVMKFVSPVLALYCLVFYCATATLSAIWPKNVAWTRKHGPQLSQSK